MGLKNNILDLIYKKKPVVENPDGSLKNFLGMHNEPWTKRREIRWWLEYGIGNNLDKVKRLPYDARCTYDRSRRGWSNYDTSYLPYYLADIILGSAKFIKAEGIAIPIFPESYLEDGMTPNPDFDSEAHWNNILDEIIWTFTTVKKIGSGDWEYFHSKHWTEDLYNRMCDNSKEIAERFGYEPCYIMTLEESVRLENGLHLFADQYFNLESW